ncbi:regulatory protein RecX [Agromyces sp. GXQ0307]|uniref:regulatory protein RecX n=1 Tax=Agromyces sp. GXQ0307 TaxID=3377835 RepID=UPI00383ACA09
MTDQRNERLAPVTYLPWVAPSERSDGAIRRGESMASGDAEPPAESSTRHDRGAARSDTARSFPQRRSTGGRGVATDRVRSADPDESETGPERDDRIDRLIVSRLRRSSLSVSEVRATLVEHGLDEVEVEEWIERYARLGYLDDRRLAEQLVHSHGVRRGRGSGALLHELGRRGIDDELAREAVDTLDPDVEFEHALLIAERRARQLTGLDRQVAERRLSAFLMRRGYGSELVRRAVVAALDGDDAE